MLMAQCFLDREFYQSTIVVLSTSRLVPRSSRFVINDFSYEDLLWLKEHISEPGYWMKLEIFRRMATARTTERILNAQVILSLER